MEVCQIFEDALKTLPNYMQVLRLIEEMGKTMTNVSIDEMIVTDVPRTTLVCDITHLALPEDMTPHVLRITYPEYPSSPENFLLQPEITLFIFHYIQMRLGRDQEKAVHYFEKMIARGPFI